MARAMAAAKDKELEAEAEGDGPDAAAATAGIANGFKKFLTRKNLLIALPAAAALLLAGSAGVTFLLLRPHPQVKLAKTELPLTPPQVVFSDVPDILVNIQSSDGSPAYLKLSVSLELDNQVEKAGLTALMPRLVDQFQSYLRELRVDDLKGSEGVLRLKEELLRRVNAAIAPYHVRDVLLKQMIVQ
ncbi:MAG: flagellar basal body-associated FliL family protein [Rhizomicrobium sp.]